MNIVYCINRKGVILKSGMTCSKRVATQTTWPMGVGVGQFRAHVSTWSKTPIKLIFSVVHFTPLIPTLFEHKISLWLVRDYV